MIPEHILVFPRGVHTNVNTKIYQRQPKSTKIESTYYWMDHMQSTLLNWDSESVLALNKKLEFPIHIQVFI